MKIVIDTNIVFSAILNTKSKIGLLILNGSKFFDFYSVGLLQEEIYEHKDKIIELTNYTPDQFDNAYRLITKRINFVDDILLTEKDLEKAMALVAGIDEDDAAFIALNIHLSSYLWTGDKRLINGLRKKGYRRILETDDLYDIFLNRQLTRMKKKNR
jgi:predicted nucleic acid-binding protein